MESSMPHLDLLSCAQTIVTMSFTVEDIFVRQNFYNP